MRRGRNRGESKGEIKKSGIMTENGAIRVNLVDGCEQSSFHFLTERGKGIMMC